VTVPLEQQGVVRTPRTDELAYATFGLRVAPAHANGDLLVDRKAATCDPQIIAAMWDRWPFADVAWVTPPTILVVVENRYRRMAQFGRGDARSVDTPAIATETGGACLLFAASSGPYRPRTAIKDSSDEDTRIEVLTGSNVLLPSAGTGRF
jgi:hypothetical protein